MAIMEGRARAAKRELKLPWLTEFFARQKALKSFESYFEVPATVADRGSGAVLAALRDMEKRGVAMTIKRVERLN